jgi:hypothetical protein
VVITRLLPFALSPAMAQEKSGSAGAEKPPEKPLPVIEPTIKDLT